MFESQWANYIKLKEKVMSKTKITLEKPFSDDWDVGYLNINREDRKMVYLYNPKGQERSTVSYARYLVSCSLKRYLRKEEHVDHINNDKTCDKLENLQILSKEDNSRKYADLSSGVKVAEIRCPACSNIFLRRSGNTQVVPSLKGKVTCCNKKCSSVFRKMGLSKEEQLKVSENSVLSVFQHKGLQYKRFKG